VFIIKLNKTLKHFIRWSILVTNFATICQLAVIRVLVDPLPIIGKHFILMLPQETLLTISTFANYMSTYYPNPTSLLVILWCELVDI